MKSKRDREEACHVCQHYHDFEGGEPCGICGHVLAPHLLRGPHQTVLPTAIVPGFLHLGSYDTASRSELLKAFGITHILNTVPNCQPLFKNTFTYHTVATSPAKFEECFQFLDLVKDKDSRVLVYCMSGQSRAPAIVIGYLMKLRQWRLAESYCWVKDKRPNIRISADDEQRLQELELQLLGNRSVPLGLAVLDQKITGAFGSSLDEPNQTASSSANQPDGAAGPHQQPFAFGFSSMDQGQGGMPFSFGGPAQAPFVFGEGLQSGQSLGSSFSATPSGHHTTEMEM